VGTFEEQTKGFQRLQVGIAREGVKTQVRKLIFGACIKPYMRNDMFHMMLEMEYTMQVILVLEMFYLCIVSKFVCK
jgi:hypothetical protein